MKLEEIAKNYMSIWNSGNQDKLDDFAVKNLKVDYPHFETLIQGTENYKKLLKQSYFYFPDIRINLTEIISNELTNVITVFWNYQGTHKNGEIFGLDSTGKKVKVEGITVLDLQDGLVKIERGIIDNMSLMIQLKS
ncbi:MAG: ester cyclase [Salegentibacter sp.]